MLVGRTAEIAVVEEALRDAAAGRGRLVLVTGPPGIGKSAVADAAAELAAARGWEVVRGHAIDDAGAPALWPWRRLAPTGPSDPDPDARFALFAAVAERLRARSPALLLLEDLHWADPLSLALLRHVCAELPMMPVCLVATARDRGGEAVLTVAGAAGARSLRLAGLDVAAIARWRPGVDAASVFARTGGNPLLVRLLADGAGSLAQVAAVRLAALDEPARAVVDAAAVLAERVDEPVLTAMVGQPIGASLAAAIAAGVLRVDGGAVVFEHALVRDAVLTQLAPGRAAGWHRAAAVALAGDPDAPPGPIARHWQLAGDAGQCHAWAVRADEAARATFAFADARRFAELALDRAAPEQRPEALTRLAEAQYLAGAIDDSLETCRSAADAATAAGRPDLLARAGLAIVGIGSPPLNRAVATICRRALAELGPDETALRARLLAQIAVGAAETDGGAEPAESAARALAAADLSGDPRAILEALAARHLAISTPFTVTERLELGRRAIELGARADRVMPLLWGHLWRADAALQLGNLPEFDHELAEIDRVARVRRSPLARWHHHRWSAVRAVLVGDFAAARDEDAAAFALATSLDEYSLQGMTFAFRGQLALLRGDPSDNQPQWQQVLAAAPPMPLIKVGIPTQLALAGQLDEARAAFEPFRALPARFPVGVRWSATVANIGQCAVLLDDADVAGQVHDVLAPTAAYYSGDGSGGIFSWGHNTLLLGDLARVAGRLDVALSCYRDAVTMNLRLGARPFVALARLGWARVVLARGGDGGELLAAAAAEFARLDMPGPLTLAQQLARVPETPLTPREAEIATLVAQARSNREIAAALFLSERTVETHVRNILVKLGFTTRTEIATWQVRRDR